MKRLARLFSRSDPSRDTGADNTPGAPPAPERLTYAIGDIHGCADPLDALLERIETDAGARPHDIVFLGDYVDRGLESERVLRRLLDLDASQTDDQRLIFLAGNHDRMLMHYLAEPEDGVRWLWVGGSETVTSFGIGALRVEGDAHTMAARVAAQAQALAQAMGEDMIQWLAQRPLWWQTGNIVAVHALTDPDRPMVAQSEETLVWARPGKDLRPRTDGTWVVHGHTIVAEPTTRARHVNVDTGAFKGGPLTAAVFTPEEPPRFLRSDDPVAD